MTPSTNSAAVATDGVSEDELLRVLSDSHRRSIVSLLAAEDGPVRRRAVVEHLATNDEERQCIAIRMHHVHLPKLVDAGLAVHDANGDTLASGENTRRALRVMTAASGGSAPDA